jgi:5-methylcytosine-specific restriction endonuclease McrA
MTNLSSFVDLSDQQLLIDVARLAACERRTTAALIASLAEFDARRLYLGQGCSSLFTYCTQVLYLSEHAAYNRIEAARAVRRFPVILQLLADGSMNLTTITLLAPHLTEDNHRAMLDTARHKTKRDIEHLLAALHPQPAVPSTVRKLPAAKAAAPISQVLDLESPTDAAAPVARRPASTCRAVVAPLAPEQYKLQVTISRETHDKLRRAQDLLRHQIPNGDPAVILNRALTLLVSDLERTKYAATERPRAARQASTRSRHIPAAVRREVWKRDAGRCAFEGENGRCTETGFLEFHHVVPYADRGDPIVSNLQLRCRAHNSYEADKWFGPLLAHETAACYSWTPTRSGTSSIPAAVGCDGGAYRSRTVTSM